MRRCIPLALWALGCLITSAGVLLHIFEKPYPILTMSIGAVLTNVGAWWEIWRYAPDVIKETAAQSETTRAR
jgi:hypothetical protein